MNAENESRSVAPSRIDPFGLVRWKLVAGAGLTEGASTALMAAIVPAGFVPYYNLLWRFSTAYLAALAGLVCLLHAVARDLGKTVRRLRKGESRKMATDATAIPRQERMEVVP